MTLNEQIACELFAALVEEAKKPGPDTRQPGDFTRAEFQQAAGLTEHKAQTFLSEKVKAGILRRLYVTHDGERALVYRQTK